MRRSTKSGKPVKRRLTMAALRAVEARIDRKCWAGYGISLYSFDAPTLRGIYPARHKALVRIRKIAERLEQETKTRYLERYNRATYGLQAISA